MDNVSVAQQTTAALTLIVRPSIGGELRFPRLRSGGRRNAIFRKQFRRLYVQCTSQGQHCLDGNVTFAAFDPAYMIAVQFGQPGQVFLGQATRLPELADSLT
ncbi:hypothetical protein SIDU_12955 [Sphingobium indicum B90A]|uniref:Uncharacterized protein n=1 Tax=Sphingobium indicum (strain DSM 16412 / CCM 7286 / MTCC 6364 / B90A) TaxID=861109 RepID=A0A1L5BRE0_SPHIB|nr:hypothetical protein SIDU_12955 [Sphingobium indicum B90A]